MRQAIGLQKGRPINKCVSNRTEVEESTVASLCEVKKPVCKMKSAEPKRARGFLCIRAEVKSGMATVKASQAVLMVNSHFEPDGFLAMFAAASTGTNTLLATMRP